MTLSTYLFTSALFPIVTQPVIIELQFNQLNGPTREEKEEKKEKKRKKEEGI